MRFRKGEKVEVVNQKEAPASWRVAHVLSGNENMYRVVYDSSPGWANVRVVETVSQKFMRPCPPLVQGVDNWFSGDIVEVFHEFSWKIAVILKVARLYLGGKRTKIDLQTGTVRTVYSVRLLGCSQELVIDSFNMRNRQTWHDDKWVLMKKGSQQGDDVLVCDPSTSNRDQKTTAQFSPPNPGAKRKLPRNIMNIKWDATFRDDEQNEHVRKFRATEKERTIQRVAAVQVTEKGNSWMQINCSKGLKMMMLPRVCRLSLGMNFWAYLVIHFQMDNILGDTNLQGYLMNFARVHIRHPIL